MRIKQEVEEVRLSDGGCLGSTRVSWGDSGRTSVRSSGGSVGTSVLLVDVRVRLGRDDIDTLGDLAGLQHELRVVETRDHPDVVDGEDGLGDDIKDTVKDHLAVSADDVATISKTPSDRVEKPDEGKVDGRTHVGSLEFGTEAGSRLEGRAKQDPPNVDESGATKGKVTPLVDRDNKRTDETGDDHDLVKEDQGDDVRKRETGSHDELKQQGRGGDDPVDVTSVPDGTSAAGVTEFNVDGGATEVGSHGEVGDGGGGQDENGKVVEDAATLGQGLGPNDEDQVGQQHDGEDRPEPVGTMAGDGLQRSTREASAS